MTAKKRTNPLQRTTTDASKAKLPRAKKRTPKAAPPIPCMDWPADSLPSGKAHYIPPDAAPFPWPLRFANWLDDLAYTVRTWLALRLEGLARRVKP